MLKTDTNGNNGMRTESVSMPLPRIMYRWLREYGVTTCDEQGAMVRYFDQDARDRLRNDIGMASYSQVAGLMDCYMVLGEGGIILRSGFARQQVRGH